MISEPGIYDAVPIREYINDPCPEPSVSTSVIETLANYTPLHARAEHPRLGNMDRSGSKPADLGSAIHQLVLGGDQLIERVPYDSYSKKDAQSLRDAARAAGRIPVLASDWDDVLNTAAVAREVIESLGGGRMEHTLIWHEQGVWCRARPDLILAAEFVIDLKTTDDADPMRWSSSTLANQGYDSQGVHVLAGIQELLGETRDFAFLVIEKTYPHAWSLVRLDDDYIGFAHAKREHALKTWRHCLTTNEWPGYPTRMHAVGPKPWKIWELEKKGVV